MIHAAALNLRTHPARGKPKRTSGVKRFAS